MTRDELGRLVRDSYLRAMSDVLPDWALSVQPWEAMDDKQREVYARMGDMVLAGAGPRWTKDKPQLTERIKAGKSDWYWYREGWSLSDTEDPPLEVYLNCQDQLEVLWDDFILVEDMPGEWAGPIPTPVEPDPEPEV